MLLTYRVHPQILLLASLLISRDICVLASSPSSDKGFYGSKLSPSSLKMHILSRFATSFLGWITCANSDSPHIFPANFSTLDMAMPILPPASCSLSTAVIFLTCTHILQSVLVAQIQLTVFLEC